jgi:transcriptional regulator with AAA-type ATPase domain
MKKLLLTFTGFQDPYSLGLVGEDEQPGPILSLLRTKSFDKIILFPTPRTEKNTSATRNVISSEFPDIEIEIRELPLNDPIDYFAILKGLRAHIREICENTSNTNYYISVTSGTPQMHACWVLLAASGEIPARILNVRPDKFVSKDNPLISEIDLTSPDFPTVRSNVCDIDVPDLSSQDYNTTIKKLGIVGDHPAMIKALETGAMLAPSFTPIFLLGETGTGKELFAKFVHLLSGRQSDRFIPLNCAAIPKDLVESILFGHKKGSFTGATVDQIGKFDQADGGTLFLDELGELPLTTQAKLLRVLADGVIEPLGDTRPHKVDVRIIAATNLDIRKAINKDRKSDIPKIALHVLDRVNSTLKRRKRLSPDALTRLQNHSWPGNVRDLENVIERSARLARQDILNADDLIISEPITYADPLAALPEPDKNFSLEEYVASVRNQLILRAIEIAMGNKSEAARLLGITPQAVHKFLKKKENNLNRG